MDVFSFLIAQECRKILAINFNVLNKARKHPVKIDLLFSSCVHEGFLVSVWPFKIYTVIALKG